MRDRLAEDLIRSGRHVVLPLDARVEAPELAVETLRLPADRGQALDRLQGLVTASEALLLVAPEGEPAARDLVDHAARAGCLLLGCDATTLALTADKLTTIGRLRASGLAVPATRLLDDPVPVPDDGSWVVKPRFGAGCLRTMLRREATAVPASADWIAEPLAEGVPLSLTLLCADGRARLLTVNRQLVRLDQDAFHFDGVIVAGAERRRPAMEAVAAAIAAAIPSLFGLVGVDLIDTVAGPVVLEINPRPTTAYAGLSASLGCNAAALLLDLVSGGLPAMHRAPTPVEVRVDG